MKSHESDTGSLLSVILSSSSAVAPDRRQTRDYDTMQGEYDIIVATVRIGATGNTSL